MIGLKQRVLEKLAYRYWLKDPSKSAEENWKRAKDFLNKLEKRYVGDIHGMD